ncbi:hypothetical protein [Mesorhizobium sp. LNHC229A00]|uniref:hypothetical protein n=1 Tax=Mesorhizobium sp. LNHC229A00 TaxID=1287240 RepID=UPI0003CE7E10|nr:hypothetical protein [Mesorhizobium sp. LNHC229A00]ESY96014.1 hypothetical protein X741_03945 [Mesorhizobium sp. LNHC229A00]
MKTIVLATCLTLVAAQAQAISRYDPTRLSCGKVQSAIARQGAVILRYQSKRVPGLPLYDRYVQSQQFCTMGEVRTRAYVPSADTKSCPVYNCKRPDNEHFRHRFIRRH